MKAIILFLSGLFFAISAMGQGATGDAFTAMMPKGATKLSKEKLESYVNSNFKSSGVLPDNSTTYQVDGMLISVWSLFVNPDYKRTLQDSEAEMIGILKRNDKNIINFSKIIMVNGIKYWVYEYQKSDEVYLRFQSDFNKEYKNINGVIQFKEPDKDKAHKVLDEFLQTVHFKNE